MWWPKAVIVWASPEADSETKIWMWMACLGDDPRKHPWEVTLEERGSQYRLGQQAGGHCGQWGLSAAGLSHRQLSHLTGKGPGTHPSTLQSLVETVPANKPGALTPWRFWPSYMASAGRGSLKQRSARASNQKPWGGMSSRVWAGHV